VTRAASQQRPLSEWNAESLRLTAFILPDIPIQSESWWNVATGGDPENIEINLKHRRRTESGPHADDFLVLQVNPGRIDWILSDRPGTENQSSESRFVDRLKPFTCLVNKWLPVCPRLMRLAVGAVLRLPGMSREESYLMLSNYLNFDLDPRKSSDFLYQINRFRPSDVISGMQINRLCSWTAVHFIRALVNLMPHAAVLGPEASTNYYCRLELDLNTAPESFGLLVHERLPELFMEMVEMGSEIAEKGDID
jgi:hypothetical protein